MRDAYWRYHGLCEMRHRAHIIHMIGVVQFAIAGVLLLFSAGTCAAQSIVLLVNDDPITTYDVAQRQRFLALTSGLGDKMRASLQSEETKERFKQYMIKEQPTSREEAQELQKKFVTN